MVCMCAYGLCVCVCSSVAGLAAATGSAALCHYESCRVIHRPQISVAGVLCLWRLVEDSARWFPPSHLNDAETESQPRLRWTAAAAGISGICKVHSDLWTIRIMMFM